jgi:NO-binding membrane sensor protein with MHYT domain
MLAKYILVALACVFVAAALLKRSQGLNHPQNRTWLLVGAIFLLVSLWLFSRP